jgi:hypothetical protein
LKKANVEPQLAQPGTYRKVFRDGETVLLTVTQRWPRLAGDSPGLRRIDRYYDALAERWRKRWEGPLLERAKAAAGPDTPPWEATLDFTVTLFQDGLFSLWLEASEDTGERRPRRVRMGDVWRVPSGVPVTLRELLPPQRWWRGPVLEEVRRQIGGRVSAGESVFYEGWPQLASRLFSPDRFYLTEQGAAVFYPMESIAPALEGFPTFSIPLGT